MIAERIHVHPTLQPTPVREWDYAATFDSYDGAPDATQACNPVGRGATEFDAVMDLLLAAEADPERIPEFAPRAVLAAGMRG